MTLRPKESSIPVWISNEWNPLKSAVIRESGDKRMEEMGGAMKELLNADMFRQVMAAFESIRPSLDDEADELARLLQQHGVQLHYAERTSDFSNNVFVRDILFGIRDQLVLAATSLERSCELRGVEHIRKRIRNTWKISEGRLEGGDVMVLSEDCVLVGQGGKREPQVHLDALGVESINVPFKRTKTAPHLDCVVMPLPPKDREKQPSLLVRENCLRQPATTIKSLRRHFQDIIACRPDPANSLHMNAFWLNPETAISTPQAKNTNQQVREMGYEVVEVPYKGIIKKHGSIRCSVAPLERGR